MTHLFLAVTNHILWYFSCFEEKSVKSLSLFLTKYNSHANSHFVFLRINYRFQTSFTSQVTRTVEGFLTANSSSVVYLKVCCILRLIYMQKEAKEYLRIVKKTIERRNPILHHTMLTNLSFTNLSDIVSDDFWKSSFLQNHRV